MVEGQVRVVSFTPTEKGADVVLSGADPSRVTALIEQFFQTNGFSLEEGTSSAGMYGKGNKVARALIGGFVKREKFGVTVDANADAVTVRVASAMSGWSGSALGRAREKKSRVAVSDGLRAYLDAQVGGASTAP